MANLFQKHHGHRLSSDTHYGDFEKFGGQDYDSLVAHAKKTKTKFVDPLFPAEDSSIGKAKAAIIDRKWTRPQDINESARLVVSGATRSDVAQGSLADCWFVAACSVLTKHSELFYRVLPHLDEQEYKQHDWHPGVFRFRFWQFGRWVEVIIDDRLPMTNGNLAFARSKPNPQTEYWVPLLEKAFANYQALEYGYLEESLCNLTGGLPETLTGKELRRYKLSAEGRKEFHTLLQNYLREHAIMTAIIAVMTHSKVKEVESKGLANRHVYSVTAVRKIDIEKLKIVVEVIPGLMVIETITATDGLMIRLRNPWGHGEWNGAWGDNSPEWKSLKPHQRAELGFDKEDDGEFWMTIKDFLYYFTGISICHVFNTGLFVTPTNYHETTIYGAWKEGKAEANRVGGTTKPLSNPQYRFDVEPGRGKVVVHLARKPYRQVPNHVDRAMELRILMIEANRTTRLHDERTPSGLPAAKQNVPDRQGFVRAQHLKRGRYLLIPILCDMGVEDSFVMRIYSDNVTNITEMTQSKPHPFIHISGSDKCFCITCIHALPPHIHGFAAVNRIVVRSLQTTFGRSGPQLYSLTVECEGVIEHSGPIDGKSSLPDYACIFFRRRPEQPVKINVTAISDHGPKQLGCATVEPPDMDTTVSARVPIVNVNPCDVNSDTKHCLEVEFGLYKDLLKY